MAPDEIQIEHTPEPEWRQYVNLFRWECQACDTRWTERPPTKCWMCGESTNIEGTQM